MSEWISVDDELPPEDGFYEVTNSCFNGCIMGTCYYDGIGFIYEHAYRPVKFWRKIKPIEKKYGKVKEAHYE